jgi:VanZ family protein
LAWAGLLLWLGYRPPSEIPSGPPGFDKVLHAGAYSVLGLLAAWAARKGILVGAIAALLVGGLDEWGQSTVSGRYPDWLDLAADVAGGALGGLAARWLIARQSQ